MNTAGKATGLGWPETPSHDVSRETSNAPATGLGWPEAVDGHPTAAESLAVTSGNVSRETTDEDAS
jgi:hypothetical protein